MRDFMEWTSQGDTPDLGRLKSKVYKEVKPREHVVMKVPKFGTLHMATSLAFPENQLRGLCSFLNHWCDNFLDSWRMLAAQREQMKFKLTVDFLKLQVGEANKVPKFDMVSVIRLPSFEGWLRTKVALRQ